MKDETIWVKLSLADLYEINTALYAKNYRHNSSVVDGADLQDRIEEIIFNIPFQEPYQEVSND